LKTDIFILINSLEVIAGLTTLRANLSDSPKAKHNAKASALGQTF